MILVGIPVLAAASALQPFGTILVLAIVAGLAAFGFRYGLFLAVLTGFGALATLLLALGLGEGVASLLVALEVPADYALPVSLGVLAVAGGLGVRFAIGGAVREETLRFPPLLDKLGGTLVGVLVGLVLAGTMLVLLSAMPIPAAYRIDGTETQFDLGTRVLKTFARLIEPDAAKREVLLHGEAAAGSPPGPEISEIFFDANGNGLFDGEGSEAERYLDPDGSKSFTPRVVFTDTNGNHQRDIGLLERYRLGAWQKLRVMHYPTITAATVYEPNAILKDGQEIFKAVAADLDPGDQLVFSLRDPTAKGAAGEATHAAAAVEGSAAAATVYNDPLFAIDPTSGSVTIKDATVFMRRADEWSKIVVVATDSRGLSTEKAVSLRYRGAQPEK